MQSQEIPTLNPVQRMTEPAPPSDVYRDMPADEYHAIDALNNSTISAFSKSPRHGAYYLNSPPIVPTAAMLFGSALHSAILEPQDFAERGLVCNDVGPSAEVAHRKAAEENPDKIILRKGWADQIRRMGQSISDHAAASRLLDTENCMNELTVIWRVSITIGDDVVEVPCKARFDRFLPSFLPTYNPFRENDGQWVAGIIDLKSCRDASADGFMKAVANQGYHRQAAWYLSGAISQNLLSGFHDYSYIVLACEKSAPYPVATYPIQTAALHQGYRECREALRDYVKYRLHGHAPHASEELIPMSLPVWAMDTKAETRFTGDTDDK